MKTIMKFTAIVAFMLITVVSMAKEPKLSIVSENDIKSLVFELDSQSKETTVQIYGCQRPCYLFGKYFR